MSLSLHARTTQTCSHACASDALSDGRPGSSALLKAPRPQHGAGCSCSVTFLQRLREEVGHSLCTQEKKTEVNPHPNHQPPRPYQQGANTSTQDSPPRTSPPRRGGQLQAINLPRRYLRTHAAPQPPRSLLRGSGASLQGST